MSLGWKRIPECLLYVLAGLTCFASSAQANTCSGIFLAPRSEYDPYSLDLTEDVLLRNLSQLALWRQLDLENADRPYDFSEMQQRTMRLYRVNPISALDLSHLNARRLALTSLPDGVPFDRVVRLNRTARQLALGPDVFKRRIELELIQIDQFIYHRLLSLPTRERSLLPHAIRQSQSRTLEDITNLRSGDVLDEIYDGQVPNDMMMLNHIYELYTSSKHPAYDTRMPHLLDEWFVASSNGVPVIALDESLIENSNGELVLGRMSEMLIMHFHLGMVTQLRLAQTPEGTFHLALPLSHINLVPLVFTDFDWPKFLTLENMHSIHRAITVLENAQIEFFDQSFDLAADPNSYYFLGQLTRLFELDANNVFIDLRSSFRLESIENINQLTNESYNGHILKEWILNHIKRKTVGHSRNRTQYTPVSTLLHVYFLNHMNLNDGIHFLKSLVDQQKYSDFFDIISAIGSIARNSLDKEFYDDLYPFYDLIVGRFNLQIGSNNFYLRSNVRWKNSSVRRGHGRHAADFGISKDMYWQAAIDFFTTTESHQILSVRSSGSIMKYDPHTHEFGVITHLGEIITYYRLDWENRQTKEDRMGYIGENLAR